jgi:hypothetical protein
MFLKKRNQSDEPGEERLEDVLLEPLAGHSDHEVVDVLSSHGAQEIEILSPGFISAQASPTTIKVAETIAFVHPKRRKTIRKQ